MTNEILYALWFFLPAGVSNATPIIAARLSFLKQWEYPLDCNGTFRGKRLFGDHKTWRGIVTGTVMALFVFVLQQEIAPYLGNFSDYLAASGYRDFSVMLGVLLGLGALLGDAAESFFKRQLNIQPGSRWVPFDQLDYIIGAILLSVPIVILSFSIYMWIFIIWFVMHLLFSRIGYEYGLKKTPI